MTDKRLRTLNINTNVVKRILKEKSRYEEEVVKYTEIYNNKVAAQAEEHDVKMATANTDLPKLLRNWKVLLNVKKNSETQKNSNRRNAYYKNA
ncbi:unnamed protein product [Schistosoma margrebowiei]|uniref:Tubulin-specific chaperone A n=1 Tax=Schistosoma margrebowiei TaxID=48269 RepID=A0AA85A860_9TREM|nr:unnamed protein product [Schistosoma margrebowiei]